MAQHGHHRERRDMHARGRNSSQMHYYNRAQDQYQQYHHHMDYRNYYHNQAHHYQPRVDERFPADRYPDEIDRRYRFYEEYPYQDRLDY